MRTSKIERRIGRSNCDMLASKKPDAKASEEFHQVPYAIRKRMKKERRVRWKETMKKR